MNRKKYIAFLSCLMAFFLLIFSFGLCQVSAAADASSEKSFTWTEEEMTESLSHATLAVSSGTRTSLDVPDLFPEAEVIEYPSLMEDLTAMMAGKADYAIVPEPQARLFVNSNEGYQYCKTAVCTDEDCFVLAKGNDELLEQLNYWIKKFREDGTIDRIYEKWVSGDYSTDDIPVRTEGEVLYVALDIDCEPLTFMYNGEIVGNDCEVIQRIAYELGMQVEFQSMPFASIIASVSSGKSDVGLQLSYSEERAQEVDFTECYLLEKNVPVCESEISEKQIGIGEYIENSFTGTFITEDRWKLFLDGILDTVVISVISFLLGSVWGAVLCSASTSRFKILRKTERAYNKIMTGIPVLVWLMLIYYVLFKGINISGVIVAILTFSLQTGASLSGVFRTGLNAVDPGQIEAAEAIGFLPGDVFKKIIFPQAAIHVADLYTGEFVSLLKSTSIVGYIAVMDLTKVSDIVRSRTYQAFFPLITSALIYFFLINFFTLLLGVLFHRINPRLRHHVLKKIK